MKLRRLIAVTVAASVAAFSLAACGNKEKETTFGPTEGSYLNVGNLAYQVQISRLLNPNDNEDKAYLVDLPADQRELGPDQAWFAVFIVGFNEGKNPQQGVTDFKITDTQGNVYEPIQPGPDNVFAYRAGTLDPGQTDPEQDTAARNNPSVNGSMLLFKVNNSTFDNRPLQLTLHSLSGSPQDATVDLDV